MSTPSRVRLNLLGTGDNFSSGGRANQAFFAGTSGTSFLVDCGPTTHTRAQATGVDLNEIDVLLVTHAHADHTFGIPSLFLTLQYGAWRKRPFTVIGPPGFADVPQQLLSWGFHDVFKRGTLFPWTVQELDPADGELQIGSLKVRAFEMDHSIVCNGYRIDTGDAIVAVSGDTVVCDNLFELSKDADLLLVDCSYPEPQENVKHAAFTELREVRSRLGAERTMLVHTNDKVIGDDYFEVPNDGDIVEI